MLGEVEHRALVLSDGEWDWEHSKVLLFQVRLGGIQSDWWLSRTTDGLKSDMCKARRHKVFLRFICNCRYSRIVCCIIWQKLMLSWYLAYVKLKGVVEQSLSTVCWSVWAVYKHMWLSCRVWCSYFRCLQRSTCVLTQAVRMGLRYIINSSL